MKKRNDEQMLNIAHLSTSTHNLGPGERAVVWVQGCPHRCAGCIAPEWLPFETNRLISPEDLLDELLESKSITGITFSGGEPMTQAANLAVLAKKARERRNLDIICFTGYRLEQLVQNPPNLGVADLLKQIDVLIDGPYIRSRNDGIGLRGSNNQHIIHLTSRLIEQHLEEYPRQVDIRIEAGEIKMIGIPPLSLENMLRQISRPVQEAQSEWV